MKICFFTYNLFGLGGIQRVLSIVASSLCNYYQVYIQCYDRPLDEDRTIYNLSEEVQLIFTKRTDYKSSLRKLIRKTNQKYGYLEKIGSKKLYDFAYLLPEEQNMYRQIITENHIDVAIAVGAFESYLLGSIRTQVSCKTIGWQHSSYKAYFETPGAHFWGMGKSIDRYLNQLDKYIVLNEYDENEFLVKRNYKVTTIHNPKSFVSNQVATLDNKRFIAAGRFILLKGFDLLIDAFEKFSKNNADWKLVIYGNGEEFKTIKRKVSEKKLEDRIELPGFSNDMKENLLESSCYVLSSRWEGMPMVVLEAMEVGLPIVSFNISAMFPLVKNEKEGLIVPAFDVDEFAKAMNKISSDVVLRRKLGIAAKEKAKLFSIEHIRAQWIRVIDDLSERN